jgi:hypothetical protein
MERSYCGRKAAVFTLVILGLSPVFPMDGRFAAWARPTRFDYVVLASFADRPSLLNLSTYRFRSEAGCGSTEADLQ